MKLHRPIGISWLRWRWMLTKAHVATFVRLFPLYFMHHFFGRHYFKRSRCGVVKRCMLCGRIVRGRT